MANAADEPTKHAEGGPTNRLARESSPYLLLHQHNPVDWFAWGEEAFEKARTEGKPIFLSVGYSTCYWCHVMERECFSNDEIAEQLNRDFVSIKLDREERPDLVMVVQKSKPYYLGPSYTMLFAAGAVAVDAFLRRRQWGWPRPAILVVLLASGVLVAPFAVAILPVDRFIAYQRALGQAPRSDENQRLGPLPQFFADRHGWEEMTATVAAVYRSLPEDERRGALIVTSNYGEAGALRYYGRHLGLPPVVSQHNNFYLWGPGNWDGRVAIMVGVAPADLADDFDSVTVAARLESPYAMPYETRQPILVCRGLKRPLTEAWREGKKYI